MFEDHGLPRTGSSFCCLGVREPGGPGRSDVDVDDNGRVVLNQKGMSVFRSLNDLQSLPVRIVPPHLRHLVRAAAGPSGTRIFSIGQGEFTSGSIGDRLELIADSTRVHGSIVPSGAMDLPGFQTALAWSQDAWVIDEP